MNKEMIVAYCTDLSVPSTGLSLCCHLNRIRFQKGNFSPKKLFIISKMWAHLQSAKGFFILAGPRC